MLQIKLCAFELYVVLAILQENFIFIISVIFVSMMEADFFAVSSAMECYETVLFDALSFLSFISISDSLTKFGLITYNCLCSKKRCTSRKSTVLFVAG